MRKNDVALLVGVILIKIATGMAMGLFGPMLPSLAKSTNVTIAQAGWLFATRSFAIFTGGCVTGLFERHFNQVIPKNPRNSKIFRKVRNIKKKI